MNKNVNLPVEYVKSIHGTDAILYDGKPQIAFIGRSNVGKSSLINCLLGHRIARSSANPGKTRSMDFFLVDRKQYFVDLPGYGFANVGKKQSEQFRKMIAWYLFTSGAGVNLVILIVDATIGITAFDRESIELLSGHGVPFVVIANKIDKLTMSNRNRKIAAVTDAGSGVPVIPFSSVTKEGRSELLNHIFMRQYSRKP